MFPCSRSKEIEELNTSAFREAQESVDAGAVMWSKVDVRVSTGTPYPQDSPAKVIWKEAHHGARNDRSWVLLRLGLDRLMQGERIGACRVAR